MYVATSNTLIRRSGYAASDLPVTEGGQTLVVVAAEVSVGVVGCLLVVGFAGQVFEVVFDDG